ncbi:MAG: ABC transporter substrate-binding protein [Myxococcota bacterium]|nr:ABC transporter substrate-binding protein [Myxococcota bacterium]
MIRIAGPWGPFVSALAVCLLLATACAGPGGRERVPAVERSAYEAALAHSPEDPAASAKALEAFLTAYPNSLLADDALEQWARLDFEAGDRRSAFRRLGEAVSRFPNGNRSDPIRLRLAVWEKEAGSPGASRRWLDAIRPERLTEVERRYFYWLQIELAENDVERLVYLSKLRAAVAEEIASGSTERAFPGALADPSGQLAEIDGQISSLLLGVSEEDLLRAVPKLGSNIPAGRIRLVLSWRALVSGDLAMASFWLEEAERYSLTPEDQERLQSLAVRLGSGDLGGGDLFLPTFAEAAARPWPSLEGLALRVGVILPLTGRYAPFGEEALRGLLLAGGVFERTRPEPFEGPPGALPGPVVPGAPVAAPPWMNHPAFARDLPVASEVSPGIELVIRDSGGSPERAAAAVRELALQEDVLAIVGPIFSGESEAAAREAESYEIPLLTLSNRVEISAERDYVFRLRMTPDDEIDRLVEYAITESGMQTFAILYPMNRYGRGMRNRYWEAVMERGGKIVAAAGYEPDATDFKASIRSMVGFDLITPNERVALQERSKALRRGRRLEPEAGALLKEILYTQLGPDGEALPPIVDFDALFIPDDHEKIQLIAPQLAYHEIEGVQLLGSRDWNDPELIRIGRSHVAGALVSTPFHPGSRFPIVQNFVAGYRESFGGEPDEFSASAFDALNLVLTQAALDYATRPEIRDGIRRIYGFPGVSGVTSILPDGNARKRPFLVEVERRRFVGVD